MKAFFASLGWPYWVLIGAIAGTLMVLTFKLIKKFFSFEEMPEDEALSSDESNALPIEPPPAEPKKGSRWKKLVAKILPENLRIEGSTKTAIILGLIALTGIALLVWMTLQYVNAYVFVAVAAYFGWKNAEAISEFFLNCIAEVPPNHFGIWEQMAERRPGHLEEGWYLLIPWIDKIESFTLKLQPKPVDITFTTDNKVQVICKGSLQYKADPFVVDEDGKSIFITMSPEIICKGVEEAVEAKLGALGGIKKSDDFIKDRQAIGDLINAILRLETPPHLAHNAISCGVAGCNLPERLNAEDLLGFYKTHWRTIKPIIDDEATSRPEERSTIEKRYGIDIVVFVLSKVDFTQATKDAFEKERQAEAKGKAVAERDKAIDGWIAKGFSSQQAADMAAEVFDDVRRDIVSVEGESGMLGGLVAGISGLGGSSTTHPTPKRKGP